MKIIRSSITSAFRANDNEIVSSGTRDNTSIGRSDALREKSTKSENQNLKDG